MIAEKIQSLSGSDHVLIMPHDNPDPDAIASSWGMSYLLRKKMGISSTIAYGGLIGRAENRALVKVLKIPIFSFTPSLLKKASIIMIDCQPHTGNSSLPKGIIPDIIIDHHRLRTTTKFKQWAYIREQTGSTTTLVVSSFRDFKLTIPKKLATAFFYAIRSETKDLGREGSKQDYENYLFLLPRVDFKALYRIAYPPLSSEYFRSVKQALDRSLVYKSVVTCSLGPVPYPELPAEIADFLIYREGIRVSLVMGFFEGNIYLSLRSIRIDVDTSEIMQMMVKGYGRGGGHAVMAGGKIPDVPLYKVKDIEKIITRRLLRFYSLSQIKGKKLY